jgi:hypothetical protein
MVEKEKSSFGGGSMSNTIVAGIDLGDTKSLATVLSPSGDVTDRFSFGMNEEGYVFFASRVPSVLTTHVCHGSIRPQDTDNESLDPAVHSSSNE